jgi:hypothetical protein
MSAIVAAIVLVSLSFFDLADRAYVIEPEDEIVIEHNKLLAEFSGGEPPSSIEVIDSLGRNVVTSVEVDGSRALIHMKARERTGYPCGVMTVVWRAGGVAGIHTLLIRAHPHLGTASCVHPR